LEAGDSAASSVLVGVATIVVSGKLAQFGSRLLVPVSDAMLAQFADNFRAAAAAKGAPAAAPMAEAAVHDADGAAPGATAAPASPAPAATAPAPAAAVKELDALALLWAVVKGWFAGLFGRKQQK
jgi:hypothetical protein